MKPFALMLLVLLLAACSGGSGNAPRNAPSRQDDVSLAHPPTAEGAKAVLQEFLVKGAHALKLRSQLKPTSAELEKIYQPAFVEKAVKAEDKLWQQSITDPDFKRNIDQTEIQVFAATTQQLRAWQPPVSEQFGDDPKLVHKFNFARVPQYVLDDLTFYRFRFVKPGEQAGAVFAALLVHVNGRWVLIWNPVYIVEFYDSIMARK